MAKKPKSKSSQDVFYIGVRDPVEVRRSLLESAREAIHFLKRYEKIKTIRAEKTQVILKLDTEVKELRNLIGKLRKVFPANKVRTLFPARKLQCVVCSGFFKTQTDLSQHMKRHQPKKKAEHGHHDSPVRNPILLEKEEPKRNLPLSELEKLEDELADIEGKLDKLM